MRGLLSSLDSHRADPDPDPGEGGADEEEAQGGSLPLEEQRGLSCEIVAGGLTYRSVSVSGALSLVIPEVGW